MDFRDAFAAALADPARPVPQGLTNAGGRIDPARFAVYRNNVAVSLAEALAARFRVVRLLVGEDFFRAMAQIHVRAHRPRSPLMFEYGDDLPDFVAGFPPAADLPYLADVTRLEIAWSRAYNAAEATALTPGDLARIDPERLGETCFAPHPAAAILVSIHPIGSIWAAHQSDPPGAVDDWRGETVLVTRPDAEVTVTIVPPADAAFAAALFAGADLATAAEAGYDADPAFDFGTALVGLVRTGAFAA